MTGTGRIEIASSRTIKAQSVADNSSFHGPGVKSLETISRAALRGCGRQAPVHAGQELHAARLEQLIASEETMRGREDDLRGDERPRAKAPVAEVQRNGDDANSGTRPARGVGDFAIVQGRPRGRPGMGFGFARLR